jgi:hypothetical protein
MRERRKERRDVWKRRGREVILIWGERSGGSGWKKIQHGKLPSLSIEQDGAERPWWRPLTRAIVRQDHVALTHEPPGRGER